MKAVILIITTLLAIAGCSDNQNSPVSDASKKNHIVRNMDFSQISRGGKLFQQNCAVCHGKQAEGAANWQQMDDNGKFPPPPLNGTAHAWHHPHTVLVNTIKNGTAKLGGNMPAWKDKLSDEEINAIIVWFQSKWSDEIYSAWYERNQQVK